VSAITPINYQPVRPRRVFKGELKEALGGSSYRESTPLDLSGWRFSLLAIGLIIFREHGDFECTFWHLETVMKKVAVVLGNSKQPLRRGKKKPGVERYSVDRQLCSRARITLQSRSTTLV